MAGQNRGNGSEQDRTGKGRAGQGRADDRCSLVTSQAGARKGVGGGLAYPATTKNTRFAFATKGCPSRRSTVSAAFSTPSAGFVAPGGSKRSDVNTWAQEW